MAKKSYKETNATCTEHIQAFMQESQATLSDFMQLHDNAMAAGTLTAKNKELIALGISISARCEGCIAAHVKEAIECGATKEEIVETINVAIMMGGGPSIIYGTKAFAAMKEFLQ